MDGLVGLSTPLPWAAAFVIGAAFGVVAERIQLCTMGAVADVVVFQSWRRARVWATMVAGTAVTVSALRAGEFLAMPPTMAVAPGVAVGGALFGVGMVLAGGCVSRAWLRACSGSLKAGLVLVVAFAAAVATLALVEPPVTFAPPTPAPAPLILAGLLLGAASSAFVLVDRRFRDVRGPVGAALALGVLVAAAIPVADGARFVPTAAPTPDATWLAFLAGVAGGVAASAVQAGRWRVERLGLGPDAPRTFAGATAMGVGAALAGGDTIALGTSGIALSDPAAWLALAAMLAGAALTLKIMLDGGLRPLLRGLGRRVSGRA